MHWGDAGLCFALQLRGPGRALKATSAAADNLDTVTVNSARRASGFVRWATMFIGTQMRGSSNHN